MVSPSPAKFPGTNTSRILQSLHPKVCIQSTQPPVPRAQRCLPQDSIHDLQIPCPFPYGVLLPDLDGCLRLLACTARRVFRPKQPRSLDAQKPSNCSRSLTDEVLPLSARCIALSVKLLPPLYCLSVLHVLRFEPALARTPRLRHIGSAASSL